MKTLKNHLILFDAECPMCNLYTGAFVRSGLLDADGRAAYQQYEGQSCPNLDWQRAVNEIALVNKDTGEVTYGVESLLKVCGHAWPPAAALFRWKAFGWVAQKAYAFISYNRRVIIAASEQGFRFQPAFKLHYRIAWLLFTWVVTSAILANNMQLLTGAVPAGAFWREFAICGGQMIFQGIVISIYQKNKTWEYLGNMMTISLAGALTLFAFLAISRWVHGGIWLYACGFLMIALLMFLEHLRRTRLLVIGWLMTATWVLYRVIILIILLCVMSANIYRHAEDRAQDKEKRETSYGFSVDVCRKWEDAFFRCQTPKTRKIALRMGIVLGRRDGAFPRLLTLARAGIGGRQGNGNQYTSWVTSRMRRNA